MNERDAALAAFGLRLEGSLGAPPFYLLPENLRAFELWGAVRTQRRYRPDGTLAGLDYAGVDAELRNGAGWPRLPRKRAALWADLRLIEREFLAAADEKRSV